MIRYKRLGIVAASVALVAASACLELDVSNPNNPDVERALASPQDVQNLAISSINRWYTASTDEEPYMMLSVTADMNTANFGNFGMRFNNLEPRAEYVNNSAGGDRGVAETPWDLNYGALGTANDVLRAVDAGLALPGGTDKFRALAAFAQAGALTNLALIFDQAFIVDEKTEVGGDIELKKYKELTTAALAKWDAVIANTTGKTHLYDPAVLPMTVGPLTSERLNKLANSMAARLLTYAARNATEAAASDWTKILAYADKGISSGTPFDVSVIGDDCNNWCSVYLFYADEPTWARVDMRVIKLMNPTQPEKFNGTITPKGTSPDARYESDFEFHNAVIGDPARGIFMQSPWSHKRYRYYARTTATSGEGPAPFFLAAENDLLIAEALVRTNANLTRAAQLINKTRMGRGNLPPVAAGDGAAALLNAIEYERQIELFATTASELFMRRRVDGVQPGTVRHLPIPAKELETLREAIYTFGGVGKPDMSLQLPNGDVMGLRRLPPRASRVDKFQSLR